MTVVALQRGLSNLLASRTHEQAAIIRVSRREFEAVGSGLGSSQ